MYYLHALTLIVITCLSCCMFLLPWLQQCVIRFHRVTVSSHYTPGLIPHVWGHFRFCVYGRDQPFTDSKTYPFFAKETFLLRWLVLDLNFLLPFALNGVFPLAFCFFDPPEVDPSCSFSVCMFSWSLPSALIDSKRCFADSGKSL